MLPFLTLAFACGLTLGSLIPYFPLSVTFLLFLAAIGATILEAQQGPRGRQATAGFCCVLTGIAYWAVVVEGASSGPTLRNFPISPVSLTGRIITPVQQSPDRLMMVVRLEKDSGWVDQPRLVQLTWRMPDRLLFQGDRIRVRAKLRVPSGSLNPHGFDYATYLERKGIDATASVNGVGVVELLDSGHEHPGWMLWNQFDRWRAGIRQAAIVSLSQPALGLFLGIIIGERGYLDQDLRDQFMVTGTVHLLSISGSHLGLIALLTFVAVKRLILLLPPALLLALSRRITTTRIAAASTVFPVTGYALLAGAEVATVRSLVMVLVALIAKWLGYEHRMFHALALAGGVILLHDPQAIYDISFQLSFLSVVAIAWWMSCIAVPKQEENSAPMPIRSRTIVWVKDAMVMSAVVTLATFPLVAFHFNQLPWLGLFTNIVAVPFIGALVVPIGLLAALWQCLSGGKGLLLSDTIQGALDGFIFVLSQVSSVPGGEWHLASPSVPSMLAFYVCLVAIWRCRGKGLVQGVSFALAAVILSWWIWSPRSLLDGDHFRVTFLDVSQGDSAVLELPDGQVVLIDGGTAFDRFDMGRGVIGPYLWNRGIRAIDHIIATHPQLDHMGGLAWVLRHFAVRHYWGNGDGRHEDFYDRIQEMLKHQSLKEQVAEEGQELLSSGACRLLVLNPPGDERINGSSSVKHRDGHAINERSVVTKLICGTHKMLFTGDVEGKSLWRMSQNIQHEPVDVVKVPHHGSSSSLQLDWLKTLRPRFAVISSGRHNPYGHPASAVLEAYLAQGVSIYRTDRDGGVWVSGKLSGSVMTMHRTSELLIQPLHFPACPVACEMSNWGKILGQWRDS
ncbi:DNA internalization-related competence protein ComEC/Rec2 [Petrachloros mirabilis]